LLRDKSDEAYFRLLHIMLSLKFTVIFYQLIESDGTVAVQIHTVIAAPITSRRHKKAGLPTHAQIPMLGDLTTDSVVLLEQIRVLDKQRLQARLGRLPYSYIQKIDKALAVSIGLWDKC